MTSKALNRSGRNLADDSDVESLPPKRARYDLSEDEEPPSNPSKKMPFASPISSKLGGLNGLNRRDRSQSTHEKPAELFRKDLISAMKLADSDPLHQDDYFLICDPWRQEWERGVQVPVNTDVIPEPSLRYVFSDLIKMENENLHGPYQFKLPKKFLHATQDNNYKQGIHELHETQKLAEQVCRYDLDDLDVSWLTVLNEERESMGGEPVKEWEMEKIIEELETQCYTNMQNMIKTVEGLGIEYDENVVCDVCRSPDSEDNNEMVFCDSCDICVHQACYGINNIPDGNWLCRTCALGMKPSCMLCPRPGGAMKSTKSGSKWAHVSCALWIPEVSIGCPEKMEPITKISQIPSSRWNLICSLCRERTGSCIQCSVKTCKTAFHVTCAFQHHLDMKTILEEDNDDVQLKAYCAKHSKKKEGEMSPRKTDGPLSPKPESEMTEEEKTELRSHRLQKLAEEFYICVKPVDVAKAIKMENEMVDFIFNYWVLKRKSNFNKPLLTPKTEEADLLSKQREDSLIARMKMFIHLRQDLERVRNLCYMVTRREKQRRILYKMKEEVFHSQAGLLEEDKYNRPGSRDFTTIASAHKIPAADSVYDQYDAIIGAAIVDEVRGQQEDEAAEMLERMPRVLTSKKAGKRGEVVAVVSKDSAAASAAAVISDRDLSDDSDAENVELRQIKMEFDDSELDRTIDSPRKAGAPGKEIVASAAAKEKDAAFPTRSSRRLNMENRNSPVPSVDISPLDKSDNDSVHSDARSSRKLRVKDQNRGSPKSPETNLKEMANLNHSSPLDVISDRKLRDRTGTASPKLRSGINGVLCSRDKLIVPVSIRDKVQNKLGGRGLRSQANFLNGFADQAGLKILTLYQGATARERENRAEITTALASLSPRSNRVNRATRGVRRSLPNMGRGERGASPRKPPPWSVLGGSPPAPRGSSLDKRRPLDSDDSDDSENELAADESRHAPVSEKRGRGRPRKAPRRKSDKAGGTGGTAARADSDVSDEDNTLVNVMDSESDEYGGVSDVSEDITFRRKLTRRRPIEDENSRDSSASTVSRSSRSSRSRSGQDWSKSFSVHS